PPAHCRRVAQPLAGASLRQAPRELPRRGSTHPLRPGRLALERGSGRLPLHPQGEHLASMLPPPQSISRTQSQSRRREIAVADPPGQRKLGIDRQPEPPFRSFHPEVRPLSSKKAARSFGNARQAQRRGEEETCIVLL